MSRIKDYLMDVAIDKYDGDFEQAINEGVKNET